MTKAFRFTLMMFLAGALSLVLAQNLRGAILDGDVDAVRAAIEAGEDLDALDDFGDTALMDTVYFDYPEIAALLIDAGADVDAGHADDGRTPLMIAMLEDDLVFGE